MQPPDEGMPEGAHPHALHAPAAPPASAPDNSELQPLDPRVVKAWRATWLIVAALFGFAALATLALPDPSPVLAACALAVALLCLAAAALHPRARYRSWGYRLRDAALLVRRGVLWRTISIVPHARIQYVDTRRGPLERALGLATVVVYTAGTRGAAVRIPGLDAAHAEALRDRLAALVGADDAV
ncbi:MAG TPA: PH domain-containing protein [Longimicrobiales bacterium]